ncbi:SRPBCC family protein [Nocardia sp. CDC159]|uniref:SRPBCC family protein n=1 Tax=Nocardia pulmonis TaxID=2951408 RepID=A0A9X2E4S9_9NOCA|nr:MULTISPECIES: SRPBCC family protein [Nocardia]MCM6774152.1 SRPBCC family protein [Nocardia pulmonis]MCM6787039.1 SRPBCC family protein [Nocardia sp. CDC159]
MAFEAEITVDATPEEVFAVLSDGWLYGLWVVGASHIRDVDKDWPAVGSRIHHSVGPWPLTRQDVTTVRAVEPPHLLELDARLWPVGAARIRLELTGRGANTVVRMHEYVCRGPGKVLPVDLQQLLLVPRNTESLHRLGDIAVGRARPRR